MTEQNVPKWQRELRAFIGIKSGIILEGNVYDEYPCFGFESGEAFFHGTDNLDQTILSLVDARRTALICFDPVDGFYCCEAEKNVQQKLLDPLMENYSFCETSRNHDCTLCYMPTSRKGSGGGRADTEKYIWVSEIVRRVLSGSIQFPERDNAVIVLNFASRLDACNQHESEANTMFLNLLAATTAGQTSQLLCNTMIMVVDKYNDIPAWV